VSLKGRIRSFSWIVIKGGKETSPIGGRNIQKEDGIFNGGQRTGTFSKAKVT
jgi:hypothetical protein